MWWGWPPRRRPQRCPDRKHAGGTTSWSRDGPDLSTDSLATKDRWSLTLTMELASSSSTFFARGEYRYSGKCQWNIWSVSADLFTKKMSSFWVTTSQLVACWRCSDSVSKLMTHGNVLSVKWEMIPNKSLIKLLIASSIGQDEEETLSLLERRWKLSHKNLSENFHKHTLSSVHLLSLAQKWRKNRETLLQITRYRERAWKILEWIWKLYTVTMYTKEQCRETVLPPKSSKI